MSFVSLLLFLILFGPGAAQPAEVSVSDFAWLTGHWAGDGLGGTCDETWSPAEAGTMVGTFRLFREGKPVFYEMLLLTREESRLVLKVKHFTPGFEAWEEKADSVTFRLEELTETGARFKGLTFDRKGTDQLTIGVSMRKADGSLTVEKFNLRRVPLP